MLFSKKRDAAAHNAEEAELKARFAAIDRSQAVIEFELDGSIVTANENFLKTLGYRLDEIVGRKHALFVDPVEVDGADYRDFWRRLNAGEFVAGKFRRIGKGGREIWIQAAYNPVLDGQGRATRVMKLATDITASEQQQIAAEAARRQDAELQGQLVEALGEGLSRMSGGDLTVRIAQTFDGGYGRIRDDFNAAVDSLRGTLQTITAATDPLRRGSEEIASAADELSRRTEQQAASLEQTAAALEEITTTVKRSAEGAAEAASVASVSRSQASRSGEVVGEAIGAMGEIEKSSARERARVLELSDAIACDIHPVNNMRILRYLQEELGATDAQKTAWYHHWIREGLTAVEALLGRHGHGIYCFGDAPTLADCCVVPQVANAQRMGCDLSAYPRLLQIYAHCIAQPAFQQAAPANQPDTIT